MARSCSMMPYLQPGMPMPEDLKGLGGTTFFDFKVAEAQQRADQQVRNELSTDPAVLQTQLERQAKDARDAQIVLILASTGTTVLSTLLAAYGLRGLATAVTVTATLAGAFYAVMTLEGST